MRRKLDGFLLFLAGVVVLAWAFPGPGAEGGWLHPAWVTKSGIALIFFLHGAALPLAALAAGTLKWRVHLVIQLTTFLLFPLLGWAIWALAGDWLPPDLKVGVFFLCALPSTVSSSVALTAAARGNVAVAVFNATLSSLIGIVLTPLWLAAILHLDGGQVLPVGEVVLDLVRWLLLPFALGQLARPVIGGFIGRHKRRINLVDRAIILLLVYTSFADSFDRGVWSEHGWGTVAFAVVGSVVLFGLVMGVVHQVCGLLRFDPPDSIAAMFCGSKKTLASGVPMAQIIFAGHPGVGVILLPIMVYHSVQLILCSWLAGRWARRGED